VWRFLGIASAAAVAGAIGACAAVSGLNGYAPGECSDGCGADVITVPPEGGESSDADGTPGWDAPAGADATPAPDTNTGDAVTRPEGGADGQGTCGNVPIACDSGCSLCSDAGLDASADAWDSAPEAGGDANDGGNLTVGLVVFYPFDETGGTTAADASGNNRTATLMGGATFAGGLQNNAVTMNGSSQYVSLPNGIVSGLASFSISAWVKLSAAPAWSRIFDFGTGTNAYMFLTPNSTSSTVRFGITTGGFGQEQQLNAPALATGSWQHVAVTLAASTGTLYINGVRGAQNTTMTVNPVSLGATTQDWLGRSEFAGDPYLTGQIDNLRIYDRALSAAEVQALYTGHL
jgi:hypothetical protein